MGRFDNRVVAVTGGASGFGEAICRRLASEGARVAIIDLDGTLAEKLAGQLPDAKAYASDVTNPARIARTFADIVEDFGELDGAVNNAGVGGPFVPSADYPLDWWDKTIAVNLNGVFYALRAEIPHLIANGGGAIVNMGSICGFVGQPGTTAYVATKHAVIGMTKNVALEYGREGIRCTAVCPTYARTPLTQAGLPNEADWEPLKERHATGRCTTPAEVAALTAFLLSDDAKSITGSAHLVDGGITAA